MVAEAVALALTTSSGIGQTMIERASASGFHRACAARNGDAAAEFAIEGMRAPREVLSGPSGLIAAAGGDPPERLAARRRVDSCVIDEVTLRVYPTNGFAQSAVAATVDLRAVVSDATQLDVEVHPVVDDQFAGAPVNAHWDLAGLSARRGPPAIRGGSTIHHLDSPLARLGDPSTTRRSRSGLPG